MTLMKVNEMLMGVSGIKWDLYDNQSMVLVKYKEENE